MCGLARTVEVEHRRSFVEKARLRRVKIFRLYVVAQCPTAKRDYTSTLILDGNDNAISK